MECSIGFSYNCNPFSWLIKQKLGKEYSHVFLLFEVEGEMLVLQATRHGVHALSLQTFLQKNKIIKLIKLEDQQKIRKAYSYCVAKLGSSYGFLDIIAIALGIHYQDGEKTLICSEYVARALDFQPNKIPDLITPEDIEESYQ